MIEYNASFYSFLQCSHMLVRLNSPCSWSLLPLEVKCSSNIYNSWQNDSIDTKIDLKASILLFLKSSVIMCVNQIKRVTFPFAKTADLTGTASIIIVFESGIGGQMDVMGCSSIPFTFADRNELSDGEIRIGMYIICFIIFR